jgi:hypothetical protein
MYQHDPNSMNPQGGFAASAFTGQSWDGQHSQHPIQYGQPPGQDPRAYAYQQQMAPPEYGSMGAPPPPYGGQPAESFQQGGQPPIGMGAVRGSTFRTTGGSSAGGHSSVDGGASRFNGHPGGFAPATNLKFTQVQVLLLPQPCIGNLSCTQSCPHVWNAIQRSRKACFLSCNVLWPYGCVRWQNRHTLHISAVHPSAKIAAVAISSSQMRCLCDGTCIPCVTVGIPRCMRMLK